MRRSALLVMAVVAAAACDDANIAEPEGLGLEAARYLTGALDVMEARSVHRNEIDWVEFRNLAFEEAGNAKTPAATYDAIRAAVARLGDDHSLFLEPAVAAEEPPPSVDPTAALVEPDIGYLYVPAFVGLDADETLTSLYHELVEGVDTLGACRWVVDLRGNTGGNMWPMLVGVGPILGEGTAGYFVDPDSARQTWTYEAGTAGLDGSIAAEVTDPYELGEQTPPVAVLTDSLTASSGEAIAIAFRGRAGARSFGGSTYGVPTANEGYYMPDGALLIVAVAWMADRDGHLYESEVAPDSLVAGEKTGVRSTDAALASALGWLETVPCS